MKVRIVSNGVRTAANPNGISVIATKTGQPLERVRRVSAVWIAGEPARVTVELQLDAVDVAIGEAGGAELVGVMPDGGRYRLVEIPEPVEADDDDDDDGEGDDQDEDPQTAGEAGQG